MFRSIRNPSNAKQAPVISPGPVLFVCPTSGGALFKGFRPMFRFNCRRRPGALRRTLAPRTGGARDTFRWSLFHRRNLLFAVSPAAIKDCVSRDIPRPPLETRSPPDRPRCNYRALGAFGSNCGNRNHFSRHENPAPVQADGQHEIVTEIFCEVQILRASRRHAKELEKPRFARQAHLP